MLFEDATVERDFGWVFFCGNPHDELLAGNAPFIVDSRDGSVHVTGTAHPIEGYLEALSTSPGNAIMRVPWLRTNFIRYLCSARIRFASFPAAKNLEPPAGIEPATC